MQFPLVERVPLLCRRVWACGGAGVVSVGGVHGRALEVHRHRARGHALHANTAQSRFPARISETTDERCLFDLLGLRQLGRSDLVCLSWVCNEIYFGRRGCGHKRKR